MGLMDLPEEILLYIFTHYEILGSQDLCNLTLSCRQISSPALVSLYTTIRLDGRKLYGDPGLQRLNQFTSMLDSHPERAILIKHVDFTWWSLHEEITAKVFELLSRFSATVTLKLHAFNQYTFPAHRDRLKKKGRQDTSNLLHQLPLAQSLRRLDINDANIFAPDIAKIFTLPNLTHLTLRQFHEAALIVTHVDELSIPPNCVLKQLEFLSASLSASPFTTYMLSGHSGLEKLAWEAENYPSNGIIPPNFISKLLLPLSATLVELRLSVNPSHTNDPQYLGDFSQFHALKVLNVNHGVLFLFDESPNANPYMDSLLHTRLPSSLETLIIVFNLRFKALIEYLMRSHGAYSWLIALSNRKTGTLPHLSYVKIGQKAQLSLAEARRRESRQGPIASDWDMFEWKYPPDLALAFHESNIRLQVTSIKDSRWNEYLQGQDLVDE